MKQRLTSESKEVAKESALSEHQQAAQGLEFESVESLIRYDAATTDVSPALLERVLRDVEREPVPLPWWKRWFRK